jgi:MFS family permease
MEVKRFVREADGKLAGAQLRDALTGQRLMIRASRILAAAGPWADAIRRLDEPAAQPILRLTKGVHVTVLHDSLHFEGALEDAVAEREDVTYILDAANAAGYENMMLTHYLTEIIGTFFLVVLIYAIVDNVRNLGPGANLWPPMVGMAVLGIGLSLGGPTGNAINPARDFGPRLFAGLVAGDGLAFSGAYFLVPILGPLVGGLVGAWFYDFLVRPFLPVRHSVTPELLRSEDSSERAA